MSEALSYDSCHVSMYLLYLVTPCTVLGYHVQYCLLPLVPPWHELFYSYRVLQLGCQLQNVLSGQLEPMIGILEQCFISLIL